MDFKSIGRTWVGSVHHKFEAIRHEVDDFVTKDTVKYLENQVQTIGAGVKKVYANVLPDIENQVQTIGEGVKKVYANVVPDLENQVQTIGEGVKKVYANVLPDFVLPMAYDKQSQSHASGKQTDATGNYTRSAVGSIGMHMFSSERQSCKEEDNDGLIDCNDHQKQFNPSTSAEFPEKPNDALNPEDAEKNLTKDKHSICKDLDCGYSAPSFIDSAEHPLTVTLDSIESNSAEHPLAVTSKSLESKSVSGSSEISDVEGCMSNIVTKFATENLVQVVEFKTNHLLPEGEETALSLKPIIPFCKMSVMGAQTNASNEDIPVSEVKCSVEEKDYSGSSFHLKEKHLLPLNLFFLQEENSLCKGLSRVQIDETLYKSIEPYKVIGGDLSSERNGDVTNFDERRKGEDGDNIWIYSNSIIEENQKPQCGVKVYESSPKDECSSDLASADICESAKIVPFDESLADKYKNCCGDTRLKSDMLTSNSGCGDDSAVDIGDSNMETIDLEDKVKLEEGSVMVDDRLVHAASCRPRRFRSYKRLILDAFASRKRLIKEYEQLAILYGEIDADTSLQQEQSLFHPVTAAALRATALQSSAASCEPEWELV